MASRLNEKHNKKKNCGYDLFSSSPPTLYQEDLRAQKLKMNDVMDIFIRNVIFLKILSAL
jgi:hypothetical protein